MRQFLLGLLTTSILSTSFAYVACAEEGDDVEARLSRMEQRIMALEKKVLGTMSDGSGGTLLADHEARIDNIENESAKIYGKTEEVANAIQKLAEKVDLISKDMDLRIQDLEKNVAMGGVKAAKEPSDKEAAPKSAAKKPATKADIDAAVPEKISAEKLYDQAYDYMTKSRYATAQVWFEAFLERFPQHDRADNAWYWLGEMHLVQDRPEDAVIAFSSGLKSFPTGAKAPDNMLKMGVAFEKMGRKDLAKSTWEKLTKDFPNAASAAKAKKRLEGMK
ncbi:MAG: tol-pal system protein YbgF [Proteobacteria bacterium]|nr:tol-pal system protein YbgF [Pseudomonadota bacterium]